MAGEAPLTLHDAAGNELLTVLVRSFDATENHALRNLEGVQPPGLNRQGAFGSGIHQAGAWERDVALCDVDAYATLGHAKGALETAIRLTRSIRHNGWALPISAGVGITETQALRRGFRARVRLIPASPHWRYLPAVRSGSGSQAGTTITGAFTAADIGRLVVFADGREALVVGVSGGNATTDTDQTVTAQAYGVHDAVTGLV